MIHTIEITAPPGIVGIGQAIVSSLPALADALANDIKVEADKGLKSTREGYRQAVQLTHFPASYSGMTGGPQRFAAVVLNGWLYNAIESGWDGGNMVPWLVQGRSGKDRKGGGRYAPVRFRHTQSGTSGAVGAVMGSMERTRGGLSERRARLVGKAITRAAKKLTKNAAYSPHAESRMSMETASAAGALRMMGSASGSRPHSSSIYKGMVKRHEPGSTTYETYRTASTRVSGKWIHPGIEPHGYFEKGLDRFPQQVEFMIRNIIAGM